MVPRKGRYSENGKGLSMLLELRVFKEKKKSSPREPLHNNVHAIHTATLCFYTVTMVNFIDLVARGYVHGYGPRQSNTVDRAAAQG